MVFPTEVDEDGPERFGGRDRIAFAGRPEEDHEIHGFDAPVRSDGVDVAIVSEQVLVAALGDRDD